MIRITALHNVLRNGDQRSKICLDLDHNIYANIGIWHTHILQGDSTADVLQGTVFVTELRMTVPFDLHDVVYFGRTLTRDLFAVDRPNISLGWCGLVSRTSYFAFWVSAGSGSSCRAMRSLTSYCRSSPERFSARTLCALPLSSLSVSLLFTV